MQDALPVEAAELELDAAGPEELLPGVWRVPAPLPFGAHTVNLYLIRGQRAEDGWLLVDAPLGTSRAQAALADALVRIGISERDIAAIALTHTHPDHLGAIGAWQRHSGAPVYLLAYAAHDLYPLWGDVSNAAFTRGAQALASHGMSSDEAQALVTRAVQIRRVVDLPAQPVLVAHGQRVRLAGATYHVQWLPGHADGQLGLLRDDGLLIVGDAVLAGLTPSIGWYPWTRPDPLGDQLSTLDALDALGRLPLRLVLPGHGRPLADLAGAGTLRGAYARELTMVARLLAEQPDGMNAYTLAAEIYGQRMRQVDSRLLAVSEAVARLEHLAAIGRAERAMTADGAIAYLRADESAGHQAR